MSSELLSIQIKMLDKGLEAPRYAKPGDAGLDLRSVKDVIIRPGKREIIGTGVAVAIPDGFAGFVQPRSGLAAKQGMTIVNTPGLIDSGYRGEICVIALNTDDQKAIEIKRGDRVAQLVIVPVPSVRLIQVDELDETSRGTSGFGSSGK